MTGLYIHIPFCSALCPYCDFAVVVGRAEQHERYVDALIREARGAHSLGPFQTVFIGGGTPSFIEPSLIARVLSAVEIAPGAEVTMESNPESVDRERASIWRAAGVNRLSIGVQSFDDRLLQTLGRTHDAAFVAPAVAAAREAGFDNISLDLIYGSPDESVAQWESSLAAALVLEPEHLSCYALTIEERTSFGTAVARGTMSEPDQDDLALKYERAIEVLERAGYEHYEISNWARPGRASQHNLVYWTQGDYVGLGLGAHSHHGGTRSWNTRTLASYLSDPTMAREGVEHLTQTQQAEEWVGLHLRLMNLDVEELQRRLGRDLGATLATLQADGLILDNRLTTRGMLLENEVTLRLLTG